MGSMLTIEGADGVDAYLAEPPTGVPPRGGLVVIHEAWGLVDHIMDVADRFAAQGYVVLAPDLLRRVGIQPQLGAELQAKLFDPDPAVRSEAQPRLREAMAPMRDPAFGAATVDALRRTVDLLLQQPRAGDTAAVIGFCFGGTYSIELAGADDRIRAAVAFYGLPPQPAEVHPAQTAILELVGDRDERLMTALPEARTAFQESGVDFSDHVYEGVGHAFFNDTNPNTYDAGVADDAWSRTLRFLDAHAS
jgi:carboxymethylenebutenolidase